MPGSPKADPTTRRPRRWRRRLAITGLLLLVLILFIAGPGSRLIIKTIITNQFEKQGLTGSFEISGRVFSGYMLEGVSFSGSGVIRSLQAAELGIDYRFLRLIDKQIDRLSGRDISIVLHPEPKPEEAEEEDAPLEIDLPEDTIQTARGFALPIEIDLQNVSLKIHRDEQPPLEVQISGLSHQAGEDVFRITGFASNILGESGFPLQDVDIGWGAEDITLSRFVIFPSVAIDSLRLELPSGQPATVFCKATLVGAAVDLEASETGSAKLTLTDESLELRDLIAELPVDLDLAGTVNTLVLDVDELLAPPEKWRGQLDLDVTDLQFRRVQLKAVKAGGRITHDGINLSTTLGPEKDTRLNITTRFRNAQGQISLSDHPINFDLEVDSIHKLTARILELVGNDSSGDAPLLPDGSCSLSGSLSLDETNKPSQATVNWQAGDLSYDGKSIQPLDGSANMIANAVDFQLALAKPNDGEQLALTAKADLDAGTYDASATIRLPDPSWATAFIPGESPLWKPSGPVAADWKGSGSYKQSTHKGEVAIKELKLTAPNDSFTTIKTEASYDWPGAVALDSLLVQNGELKVEGALAWKDEVLTIPGIDTSDQTGPLMQLSGSVPLASSLRSVEDIFAERKELDLRFVANTFELARLQNLVPLGLPEGWTASLESTLHLTGSAARPKLDGHLHVLDLNFPEPPGVPPSTVRLEFATSGDTLTGRGTITDPDGEIIKLDAELPLNTRGWVEDPQSIKTATFKAHAVAESFDFVRLQRVVPQLAGIDGHVEIDLTAEGPISDPDYAGNVALVIDLLPLPNTPFRKLENTKLLAHFEGRKVFIDPSPITLAGGKATLSGEGSLEGEEPTFKVTLIADHALLWRNDSVSTRANAKLELSGTPKEASLSGNINLVESLFYKDIEILPIGGPPTSAPKPKLPKIDKPGDGPLVNVPAPFSEWGLDVTVRTDDPILIRGNLASGSILIDAKLAGTLSEPRPSGSIQLQKLRASLPFSTLEVELGTITLRPDSPLNPTLDIRGTSNVSKRAVDMRVSGPLSDPSYTLHSNPPLPQNEIISLLATGSISSDLEDKNTASMKAFQLMIEEFRRRSQQPGSNALFKRLMRDVRDVELSVGEADRFTGRRFNSASLKLSDKYYLTAGVDDEGNARTTITYSLGFR